MPFTVTASHKTGLGLVCRKSLPITLGLLGPEAVDTGTFSLQRLGLPEAPALHTLALGDARTLSLSLGLPTTQQSDPNEGAEASGVRTSTSRT